MNRSSRILLADDSRTARSVVISALRELEDVEICQVENGAQALQEACIGSYALLILDVEMPHMSGLQVLRMLRSRGFASTELPVIVLTKQDDGTQKVRALTDGANDYVTKPVEARELLARVRAQLELRRLHREILATQALALHAQRLAAVGQLAAAVAHELNTPAQYLTDNISFLEQTFQGVIGAVEALDGQAATKVDVEYLREEIPRGLEDMRAGVNRIASIVRAIREFSDTGSDQIAVVDVRRTIDTVLELSRARWLGVAEVTTHFAPNVATVRCYPADLKHAIWQLVVQACDELRRRPQGSAPGRIEVSIGQQGHHVEIEVRSNATPLEPDHGDKVRLDDNARTLEFARSVVEDKHSGELVRQAGKDGWTKSIIKLPSVPPN